MSSKRISQQPSLKPPFAGQMPPLSYGDLICLQFALGEIAPDWSADLQGICADEAALVVLPRGGDDGFGPTFLISREAYGFRLDQVHWDMMTEVGLFASLYELVIALQPRLAFNFILGAPASTALH
jgi:hypothetical protein